MPAILPHGIAHLAADEESVLMAIADLEELGMHASRKRIAMLSGLSNGAVEATVERLIAAGLIALVDVQPEPETLRNDRSASR